MTRSRMTAVAALLALVATPAAAQHGPVRPARADAAATALRDDDVAWLLPLLDAVAADRRRETAQLASAVGALREHASDEAASARVARLRSGELLALDELRRHSREAAVPAGARYDRACSAALTESTGGLLTTAAFSAPDVAAARAFYRERGWRVLGGQASGVVLHSPDGRLRGTLASPLTDARRIAADVERRGLRGYDHVRACTGIPDGTMLVLDVADRLPAEAAAEAARDAVGAATSEALPAALRAAGLSAAQWERIYAALWQADMDRLMPDTPSPAPSSPQEAALRRANADWLARNLARMEPALRASSTGG